MHLDLFKPNEQIMDSPTKTTESINVRHENSNEDGTNQKYESPKFFVGSGSPVRKNTACPDTDNDVQLRKNEEQEEVKAQ